MKTNEIPESLLKQLELMSNPEKAKEIEVDKTKTTCNGCQANKVRLHDVECKAKSKRYCDEKGRYWRGKQCPDCVKVIHRNYMRQTRGTRNPRV